MHREDPHVLQTFGLTVEDIRNPEQAVREGGLKKMVQLKKFMELPVDLENQAASIGQEHQKKTPAWRSVAGLFQESEENMLPEQRERALRNLVDTVLALLEHDMARDKASKSRTHSVQWDPLLSVCFHLGIARAHLTRLSREATGLAAHELVDLLRVKAVKDAMKETIRRYVKASGNPPELLAAPDIWRALKESRRGPTYHRATYALSFGFLNYMRFYRACLFYYQMAPQQLEYLAIEEVVEEIKNEKGKMKKDEAAGTSADPESVDAAAALDAEKIAETSRKITLAFTEMAWKEVKTRHVKLFEDVREDYLVAI